MNAAERDLEECRAMLGAFLSDPDRWARNGDQAAELIGGLAYVLHVQLPAVD